MNLWKVNLFDSIFFLILKSIFLTQPIPTLYLWNECTTRYDGASSLTSMEILVI